MTMMQTDGMTMVRGELVKVTTANGLSETQAEEIVSAFAPIAVKAEKLIRDAAGISVTDATQVSAIKEAYAQRRAIANERVAADKVRKALKEGSLRYGNAIQGVFNIIAQQCEAEEARLLECEKFAERAEAARMAALAKDRTAELSALGVDCTGFDLGAMKPDVYVGVLEGAKAAKERREREAAEAKAAEEKRLAEEAAERKRVAEENARLRAEKEAADRAREEAERAAKAEREALEAKARAEREAAEKALAAQKAAADKKLREERAERERLEREAADRAKAEAAAKAEAERQARAAAAAPDADKLRAFADSLCSLDFPEMTTAAGKAAKVNAVQRLNVLVSAVRDLADGLAAGTK